MRTGKGQVVVESLNDFDAGLRPGEKHHGLFPADGTGASRGSVVTSTANGVTVVAVGPRLVSGNGYLKADGTLEGPLDSLGKEERVVHLKENKECFFASGEADWYRKGGATGGSPILPITVGFAVPPFNTIDTRTPRGARARSAARDGNKKINTRRV